MDGPQRPKLVESSADHPGIRRIICLTRLNYLVILYCFIPGRLWLQNSILACFFHLNVSESSNKKYFSVLLYTSVIGLMTTVKGLMTTVKGLLTLVKVLVTMRKTIKDSFGSM